MSIKSAVKRVLEEKENRRYERQLWDRQVSYEQWLSCIEKQVSCKGGQAARGEGNSPAAAEINDFTIIIVGKGVLSPQAHDLIGNYFAEHPEAQLLYGDEDVCDSVREGVAVGRHSPCFKPDWSPDLLNSFFYLGSVVAVRRELAEKAAESMEGLSERFSGDEALHGDFREEIRLLRRLKEASARDGSGGKVSRELRVREEEFEALERLIHILAEAAGGYGRGSVSVGHIPRILFHGESVGDREKFLKPSLFLRDMERKKLREFEDTLRRGRRIAPGRPELSVVIPSRDHPDVLKKCLKGCALAARGKEGEESLLYEVIIADNGSSPENRERISRIAEEMRAGEANCLGVTYLYRPMEFNFSKMCNMGAEEARGDFLLFLNDDVELCLPGTLIRMAEAAAWERTGAVGLKLYYPGSVRIQHAGITNLPMGPVHKLQFLEDTKEYYGGANRGRRNVSAVTAACLTVERDKFREAGGFSEELKVAFNDVELCFRLYEAGYHNVCLNDLHAFHYESMSRGDDESEEKLIRLLEERDKLYAAHPGLAGKDPYYSPYLNRDGLDTGIRPAYLTAGNRTQKTKGPLSVFSGKGCRQDNCLTLRVEDCRGRIMSGWSVVLGDNNACWERMLLLQRVEEKDHEVYGFKTEGQYRPDLKDNMPDQKNVALCGFKVELGEDAVPRGTYRAGIGARNRITGMRLINWSNRFVKL